MKTFRYLPLIALAAMISVSSCKKDKKDPEPEPQPEVPAGPSYPVPATYNFSQVNMTAAQQRLAMFKELVAYVRTTHNATSHVIINSNTMLNMFENQAAPFADAGGLGLNAAGISIKQKINNTYGLVNELQAIFTEAATVSQSTVSGSDGTAGKVLGPAPTTTNGTQAAYLLSPTGFEYKELIEKGAMGGFLYSEAMTALKNIGNYNNTTVVAGQGTAQEHAWDEAFAYFGVPLSFPTSTAGLSYWGSYCNAVNGALGTNQTIMDAWLKGRAAISNKDDARRDAARDIVVNTWEKVGAARFITYMKQAKTNFANDGLRNHSLSEGIGFIRAFKYNPSRNITDGDINELMNYMGSNLYQVTQTNIDAAINKMATVFSLDVSKL